MLNFSTKRKKLALNLTPLIDVIFLLVIFFMLSTSFVNMEVLNISVSAEKSAADSKTASPAQQYYATANREIIQITVTDRYIYLNGVETNHSDLPAQIAQLTKRSPLARVKLAAADGATIQQMVDVIDNLKRSGIADISVSSR